MESQNAHESQNGKLSLGIEESDAEAVDSMQMQLPINVIEKLTLRVNTFEDLLKMCGQAGIWQAKLFCLASFCGFLTSMHSFAYAFIGAAPTHFCKLPQIIGVNPSEVKDLLIPRNTAGGYEMCTQFDLPQSSDGVPWTNETISQVNQNETSDCSEFEFSTDIFESTVVTEFKLVCGFESLASAVQAIFMIGILFGSPIFGSLSDKIGRRTTLTIASTIFLIAGPMVSLAPNFSLLMLARFILGAASPGLYATSFVLVVENVGQSWRGLMGTAFCIPFALGYMTLPAVAYFFREWRTLQLVLCAPSLFQILVCWLIPESPRWLLSKGRVDAAEAVLRRAANSNGRSKNIPYEFSTLVQNVAGAIRKQESGNQKMSLGKRIGASISGHARLFKTPRLRTRTLVLFVCWTSIAMVYYGVALNSPNLSADRYLYTFLSGVMEIPSYAMVPPLIKYLGRRKVFSGFLLFCGSSLMGSLLFSQGSVLIIMLALTGKFLIGAAYALIYLYATEVMPTILRTFGVGSASMVGRIGSAAAPFIVDLMGRDNKALPTFVFGMVALVAGVISLLLPETKNKRLPETIADIEDDK